MELTIIRRLAGDETMKQNIVKFKQYIANNMVDLVTRGNFISRVLRWLIFGSLAIFILGMIEGMYSVGSDQNTEQMSWQMYLAMGLLIPSTLVMVYSAKVFLVVIPLIWVIQCWDCIKHKRDNPLIVGNLVLWIILAFCATYSSVSNQQEQECMEWCVKEDKSNYDECAFNICDFPI